MTDVASWISIRALIFCVIFEFGKHRKTHVESRLVKIMCFSFFLSFGHLKQTKCFLRNLLFRRSSKSIEYFKFAKIPFIENSKVLKKFCFLDSRHHTFRLRLLHTAMKAMSLKHGGVT